MNPSLPLLLLLLASTPTRALDVGKEAPETFVQRSKGDPARLYALIVGATWCGPCHALSDQLAAVEPSSATAVGRAAWDKVENDVYGLSRFSVFLSSVNATWPDYIPYVLVFRAGEALGYTTVGDDLPGIGRFLKETEDRPSGRGAATLPRLSCPGRKDAASFTLGISGMLSETDHSTDRFGAATMLAFGAGNGGGPARLFAPSTGTALATELSASQSGVYFVSNPIAPYSKLIEPVSLSTRALAELPQAPGRRLRLILTGHGGADGMRVGSEASSDAGWPFKNPVLLTEPEVTAAVSAARKNGKEVRGLVLTCFGGQFGESFMPVPAPAAPACAAFATLPEKPAVGCYSDDRAAGSMSDYAAVAARALDCSAPSDGRVRHYQVALSTASRDVPMLSSEYFLLYGPGAAYLGRGATAPAPSRGVGRFDLLPKLSVYVDLIGGGVLAASQNGRPIAAPRISVQDCRIHTFATYSLDGKHATGASFLRGRVSGPGAIERADCSPVVSFRWDPEDGPDLPEMSADFDDPNVVYDTTDGGDWSREFNREFEQAVAPARLEVSLRGLKREARVLLTTVIPAFTDTGGLAGIGLENRLKEIASRLRPHDSALADALVGMAAIARADARNRRELAMKTDDVKPASFFALQSLAVTGEGEPDPGYFTTEDLVKAMWRNIGPGEYSPYEDISLFRLAHLTAAAEAELALREQALTSATARKLAAQLDSLQNCERGLY